MDTPVIATPGNAPRCRRRALRRRLLLAGLAAVLAALLAHGIGPVPVDGVGTAPLGAHPG